MKRKIILTVIMIIFTACVFYAVYLFASPVVRMTVVYTVNSKLFERAAHGDEEDLEYLVDKLRNTDGFKRVGVSGEWDDYHKVLSIDGAHEIGKKYDYVDWNWVYSETKPECEDQPDEYIEPELSLGHNWYIVKHYFNVDHIVY